MKLGLGTVQFGLDYGISNKHGMTPINQVKEILAHAHESGIRVLDTAMLYGKSEEVLGVSLSPSHSFDIVTKTLQFKKPQINQNDAKKLTEGFEASLTKLGRQSVYGLLIHHADDLLAKGGEYLMEAMLSLKASGAVKKIGVSVYDSNQVEQILEKYSIDLVQLPINVFDQRLLINGNLKALKNAGIEIHARSIFLQGLLLMPVEQMPDFFSPIKPLAASYNKLLSTHDITPLQGALSFAQQCEEIDSVILGVSSINELTEIIAAWSSVSEQKIDFSHYACTDSRMINPAQWNMT